jgi:hypothetical protein
MNRRRFFKSLAGGAAVAAKPELLAAARVPFIAKPYTLSTEGWSGSLPLKKGDVFTIPVIDPPSFIKASVNHRPGRYFNMATGQVDEY